jgi:para-nitrobenzyl esterase
VFSLNYDTLKTRLEKDLGSAADAETVLTTYRRTRPHASAPDLYTAITTATAIAESKYAQGGAPVYMYMFSHPSNFIIPGTTHTLGAAHATEIPYKFNNIHPVGQESHADVQQPGSDIGMDTMIGTDKSREKAAHNMSGMWSSFARTGRPAAVGQPAWPAYTTKTRATMVIDAECKVENDPLEQERRMWENLDA